MPLLLPEGQSRRRGSIKMELSADRLAYIYSMIGPAGVALVFVALFAVYLAVWQLIYMTASGATSAATFLILNAATNGA